MVTIDKLSSVLALPEHDLFGVPPTQLNILSDIQTEHRPLSTISNHLAPIEFVINTGYDEYINLGKSELYLALQFGISKTNMAENPKIEVSDWKNIAPINYLLNTFFKQIRLEIGKTTVTSSSLNYGYMSYIDTLLNRSPESKRTLLKTAFWHRDIAGDMESIHRARNVRILPTGNNLEEGCILEMYGAFHLDLASQMKSIIGGIPICLTLHPNDPKFYLMYDQLLVPSVKIVDIRLFMHRSKINPQVLVAHHKALSEANAKYFITRKEVKTFIIPKGTIDGYLNNIENGSLPRRLFACFVNNEAYNGHEKLYPFNFKSYGIRRIVCYDDTAQYPHIPYTPDFVNRRFSREYYGLFEAMNQVKHQSSLDITQEEFADGFTIFGFNFIPDLSEGVCRSGYSSIIKRGNLRMEVKFNQPLPETVSAIIFLEYDNRIDISKSYEVIKDFN